jgi:hypothetical protein
MREATGKAAVRSHPIARCRASCTDDKNNRSAKVVREPEKHVGADGSDVDYEYVAQ